MRRLPAPLLLAVVLSVSGCGGGSASHQDPAKALGSARHQLESTSGVSLSLTTSDLPSGVQGLKSATGTVTDAPAYEGTLGVVTKLGTFSVPVRSVGGTVYAQIPLTPGWTTVNPADYGAPDPGQLISADHGLPSLLAATTNTASGNDIRGGTGHKEVLATYSGRVPASAVAAIIPGATGTFHATYALASGDQLREAVLTGHFYAGHPVSTYTLVLTDYGTSTTVTAP